MISINTLPEINIPAEIKLLSFDVFDTLLIRTIDPPDAAKNLVAERIVQKQLFTLSAEQILAIRYKEEKRLRELASSAGFDPECSVAEIFTALLDRLSAPASLLPQLISIELEVEKELTLPMPGMIAILKKFAQHYTIVATSDTYLSGDQVRELLEVAGYSSLISKVYASSDYRVGKGSGRLFQTVSSCEHLHESEILHIGDNFRADFLAPLKLGIKAILFFDEWNQHRKGILQRVCGTPQSPFWKAHAFFSRIFSLERNLESSASQPYLWGKEVVGPMLAIFTHLLYREIRNSDIKCLFFVARDGYLLKKLFLMFAEMDGVDMQKQAVYLSLSRYTVVLASIHELGAREVKLFGFGCTRLREVIERLGIKDHAIVADILTGLGLTYDVVLSEQDLATAIKRLFNHQLFHSLVLESAKTMRENLSSYLAQSKFFDQSQHIALIDIGWLGTIQTCIEHAFRDRIDLPHITGLYFALSPPVHEDTNVSTKRGLMYDYRDATPDEMAISFFGRRGSFQPAHFMALR